jgi:TP901 family phage tail tape measure protein
MATVLRVENIITAQNKMRPGLVSAAKDLEKFRQMQSKATPIFAAQERLAGLATKAAGIIATGVALKSTATNALTFERSMYEVQRATDASGEALKRHEDEILALARATGKTKDELAGMYAAAGFAGRPVQDLARFTEYASKATVAWGMAAVETGASLAYVGNIYGATQGRIEQIGDAINTVADKSASKESDLIDYLKRVGGAGANLKISAENMLAFGATLKEVGVQTDVAATGMNALISKISTPDEGFDKALTTIGLNAKKFRKSVDQDATGSIITLLKAVEKLEGTKRVSVLKDMFGIQYADDISRMVGSVGRLNDLISIANDKQKVLGSVRSGFKLATEKDFNRIDRATQAIDLFTLRAGNVLKVSAGSVAQDVNDIVDKIEAGETRLQRIGKYVSARFGGQGDKQGSGDPSSPLSNVVSDPVGNFIDSKIGKTAAQAEGAGIGDRKVAIENAAVAERDRLRGVAYSIQGPLHPTLAPSLLKEAQQARLAHAEEVARRIGQDRSSLSNQVAVKKSGLESIPRLQMMGGLPITTTSGTGKDAKTQTFNPDFGDAINKVAGLKSTIDTLGPAGAQAGSTLASGFSSGLSSMEAAADATVARIQQKLNSLKSPSLSFGGMGGLNTGRAMPELP